MTTTTQRLIADKLERIEKLETELAELESSPMAKHPFWAGPISKAKQNIKHYRAAITELSD